MAGQEAAQARYTPVEVTIGGRPYTLRLTWRAMRQIRDRTDGRVDFFTRGLADARGDDLPVIVWACVTHTREGGDPSLTLEQVEEAVEPEEGNALGEAVFRMLGIDLDLVRALSDAAAESEGGPDPLGAEASATRSSPSGASPSPSSASASMSSGGSPPASTPPSATLTIEPSGEPTSAPA